MNPKILSPMLVVLGAVSASFPAACQPDVVAARAIQVVRPATPENAFGGASAPGAHEVEVLVTIDANGKVTQAKVEKITGVLSPLLTLAALAAARQWKFQPALVNGRRVPSQKTLKFDFSSKKPAGQLPKAASQPTPPTDRAEAMATTFSEPPNSLTRPPGLRESEENSTGRTVGDATTIIEPSALAERKVRPPEQVDDTNSHGSLTSVNPVLSRDTVQSVPMSREMPASDPVKSPPIANVPAPTSRQIPSPTSVKEIINEPAADLQQPPERLHRELSREISATVPLGVTRPLVFENAPKQPPAPEPEEYRVGPGDVLQIDVWNEPDASSSVTVRPDGKISPRLIGDMAVAGLTPATLGLLLSARYSAYIRTAHVSVAVREINSRRIYVIGEVKKEGAIRLDAPLTVLQALAEAGGLSDYAKRKKIYILRGTHQSFNFNFDEVVRGTQMQQNILLMPGDTVIVPR